MALIQRKARLGVAVHEDTTAAARWPRALLV
jgi:hypothetical protein